MHRLPQVSQAPGVLPHVQPYGVQSGQTEEHKAGSESMVPDKNNHAVVYSASTLVYRGGVWGGIASCSNGIICLRTVCACSDRRSNAVRYANVHHLASISSHDESDAMTGVPPFRA
jgi:hypothetical protein